MAAALSGLVLLLALCWSDAASVQVRRHRAQGNVVQLDVYYETLCPYCNRFMNEQLAPLWSHTELRPRVNISMIAYGNAMSINGSNVSAGYRFWHPELRAAGAGGEIDHVHVCQHGPQECFGNQIHLCLLALKPREDAMATILCMENNRTGVFERSSYECAADRGLNMTDVRECAQGPQGNALHYEAGRASLDPALNRSYVPWVLMGGAKWESNSTLVESVCEALTEPLPAVCASLSLLHRGAASAASGHVARSRQVCHAEKLAAPVA